MNYRKSLKNHLVFFVLASLFVISTVSPSLAQQPGTEDRSGGESSRPPFKIVTQHTAVIGGKEVKYKAVVEETFFYNEKKERSASVVSISYVRTDIENVSPRPVVFAFNGGPGAASIWTNFGLLGPCRVLFQDQVNSEEIHPKTVPPFLYGNNPDSLLDAADIVLFDPPGTGFSRVLGTNNESQFYGVEQDAKLTCEFIENWITKNGRWNSSRFLLGESYGTIRAAEVAYLLTGGPFGTGKLNAITLNGVILLGQAMDLYSEGVGDVGFLNALPTLAATAWYHGKISRENKTLEQHVDAARSFAANDYLRALYAGSALSSEERIRIAERLSALIGLPKDLILEHNLRLSSELFEAKLLKAEGKQLGAYDGRFTLPLNPSGRDPVADDPAMAQYTPSMVAAFNEYLKKELGVEMDLPYNTIEFKTVNFRWDYGFGPGISIPNKNYADDLAVAMRRNPSLKLFVGAGYFDFVTPIGSAEYTIAHADIDPSRVSFRFYKSGHMAYIGEENRKTLADDLRRFIAAAGGK
jgi:carboxypeptidase C (cathepsin A)